MYRYIEKAVLEIALDNGTINRSRPVADLKRDMLDFLAGASLEFLVDFNLAAIDRWLGMQESAAFQLICSGEEGEMKKLLKNAPRGTGKLLSMLFEKVV